MKDKLRVNFLALKRLIRRNKEKAIAITTAAVLTGGIVIGAVIKKHEKDIIEPSSSYTDEIIGPKQDDEVVSVNTTTYGTYLTDLQQPLNGSSFALVPFEITYSDTGVLISKSIYEEYSKYAEDNKVEIGYMFNPTSTDRASMYLAIKELKDIMTKYDVNYPIIYNVDCLYNNNTETNREYNYSILKSFIDKMNENKCYVMIAGSKESLDDMENRFNKHSESGIDYKQIDKLVFGDIELKDDICMKLVDNKIESRFNYTAFIDSYGYNDSNHFVDDYTHIVKPGDTLYQIANTYNTTVNAIKSINNLTSNNLSIGQTLILPNN